ncbi:helix-turn-helix domain-containing protein [Flagellimonas meridianipacifica]|uniref:AraC-like DNA-binding protein n=1 Tax=Flagellimonas meridianipacifica TaxID=1080225 RepID=A0A2T0MBG8_9FLAO|nr:helix-turn-helix domain-containing protein [Allomuricauda pacifica]PRX54843.1 AraC-like DNA-binding protein [Allomuricauda pacifica]
MKNFDFVDLILFLGVSQGFFLAVALRLIHNRNKSANRVLSLLLMIAVLMLFGRIAAFRVPEIWIWRFGVLIDTTIFLFGPLIYTYTRRLAFKETPLYKLALWHYIPAALHLGYYFWALSFSLEDFNKMYFSGELNLMFFIVEAAGLISFSFYWIKSVLLLKKYFQKEKEELSFNQSVTKYLSFLLGTLGLFIILWQHSFLSTNLFQNPYKYVNYVTMWISTPLFVYVIGYFSLRQPDIFRIPFESTPKSTTDRLKPDEIRKLQKRLHYFIEEESIYEQPDLSLKVLADKLNTTSNNLSWLLNQVYQMSFYDYINDHRIKAFLKKIDERKHANHTLLALAMDVGFNSKSTFNRVFKLKMGTTPKEYVKGKKVA